MLGPTSCGALSAPAVRGVDRLGAGSLHWPPMGALNAAASRVLQVLESLLWLAVWAIALFLLAFGSMVSFMGVMVLLMDDQDPGTRVRVELERPAIVRPEKAP